MDNTNPSPPIAETAATATPTCKPDDPRSMPTTPPCVQLETELKFAATPDLQASILESGLVRRTRQGKAAGQTLLSTYFDTRQHKLRQAGAVFRVRQKGAHFEQTLKIPVAGPVGMQNCEEWTTPLPGPDPELSRLDRRILSRLQHSRHPLQLAPVFSTEIERITVPVKFKSAGIEIALDQGTITSHGTRGREQAICEVELELLSGNAAHMLEFALKVVEKFALLPLFESKAHRGYVLARPSLRAHRLKAEHVDLNADMSAGQSFQITVAESLRQLQRNIQPVVAAEQDGIHQARVSIRRVRAALRAHKKMLPYDKRKAFSGEFRWFQRRLAPARDWHVFLSETLPLIEAHSVCTDNDLALLRRLATRERRHASAAARQVINSRRFLRLMLEFQRWLLELERDKGAMFEVPLQPFARSVLHKTRREFLSDGRSLSRMPEKDRHSLRKSGKKARYSCEFFAGLWRGPLAEPYINQMEELQDQLGATNDAVVARVLIAGLPPRALRRSAMQLVQDWSRERELQCLRTAQPVWRNMRQAAPFWS